MSTTRSEALRQALAERILVLDGATGTALEAEHLDADDYGGPDLVGCHEALVLHRPDIVRRLHERYLGAGADIAKVAVMPKNHNDVLTLLRASWAARKETVDCPIVTMSMGEEGVVSRLAGGLYGSDITFAVGMGISAPGQIPIAELRQGMAVLYRD